MIATDTEEAFLSRRTAISKFSRANSQGVSQSPHRSVKESRGAGIELGSSSDDDEAGKWLIRPDVVISGPSRDMLQSFTSFLNYTNYIELGKFFD
jgi:hypothetical protein